jgi:pimeloyl-ACP methyl ester carboxylesterase
VTVLAESFGACLALRCAVSHPQLFARMTIVNPV